MASSSPQTSLSQLSVAGLLDALAAATPAPGGGAAAALAAAMGAALIAMVAGLTVGRPRYAAVAAEMAEIQARAEILRQTLVAAADDDTAAYLAVMAAHRLPRESAVQQADRGGAIQAALRRAAEVPLAVAAHCVELLDLAGRVAARGNPNAASDAAVAALLAHAGLQGAVRNVRINLNGIGEAAFCAAAEAAVAQALQAAGPLLADALAAADARG